MLSQLLLLPPLTFLPLPNLVYVTDELHRCSQYWSCSPGETQCQAVEFSCACSSMFLCGYSDFGLSLIPDLICSPDPVFPCCDHESACCSSLPATTNKWTSLRSCCTCVFCKLWQNALRLAVGVRNRLGWLWPSLWGSLRPPPGGWRPSASAGPCTPAPNSQLASYVRTLPAHCQLPDYCRTKLPWSQERAWAVQWLLWGRCLRLWTLTCCVFVCFLVFFPEVPYPVKRESLDRQPWRVPVSLGRRKFLVNFLNPPLECFLLLSLFVSVLSCVFLFFSKALTVLSPVVCSAPESCSNHA